jgi:hypothetical protein
LKPIQWCYIACPYSEGDSAENVHLAAVEWDRLFREYPEVTFINPLWSALQQMILPLPYEWWLGFDLRLIRTLTGSHPDRGCVYRFRPGVASPGADREIALAKELGVVVARDAFHLKAIIESRRTAGRAST